MNKEAATKRNTLLRNSLALLYNVLLYNAVSFYFGRWNTGTNPELNFASVSPYSGLPNRSVLEKFPGHNINFCLL